MKNDTLKAKQELEQGNFTCVAIHGKEKLSSNERGIKPLLEWIDNGISLVGFSVADKVVGKAASLLYAYMQVDEVYANVVSRSALEVFAKSHISIDYAVITDAIINRRGDGICPMEDTVKEINVPSEALTALRNKLAIMSEGKGA